MIKCETFDELLEAIKEGYNDEKQKWQSLSCRGRTYQVNFDSPPHLRGVDIQSTYCKPRSKAEGFDISRNCNEAASGIWKHAGGDQ